MRLTLPLRWPATLVAALALGACAPAMTGGRLPSPDEIPSLESRLAENPGNSSTAVRLGLAYREAGRLTDARRVLEGAVAADPEDATAIVHLGLTYEDLEMPAEARSLYGRYLEVGAQGQLRSRLRARLPLLERQELVLAARSALAREAELANTPPRPRTVAVFPFLYEGEDPQLRPLSRALAEMLTTDLSQTERLTVLERARVQLLLDEARLAGSGLVDSTTAVRGGRLLGADRIVQGRVDGDDARLRLQAAIVGIGGQWDGRALVEQDAARQLFDMQKRLALALYSSLGVELTPAERERVTRRYTDNLQALLAFGQCLEAEDAGNHAAAAASCRRAAALDPGFAAARQRAETNEAAAAAMQVPTSQIALLAGLDASGFTGIDAIQVLVPVEPARNAAPEAFGNEGIGTSTNINIIIRRP